MHETLILTRIFEYTGISKTLVKLMVAEKANAARRLLMTECDNGVHEVNSKIISKPEEKQINPVRVQDNTLLYGSNIF